METWLHDNVTGMKPNKRAVYARKWYDMDSVIMKRVAKMVKRDPSWLESTGVSEDDAEDIKEAMIACDLLDDSKSLAKVTADAEAAELAAKVEQEEAAVKAAKDVHEKLVAEARERALVEARARTEAEETVRVEKEVKERAAREAAEREARHRAGESTIFIFMC
jgi:hypothetical protein